jgi:hypothetical protein
MSNAFNSTAVTTARRLADFNHHFAAEYAFLLNNFVGNAFFTSLWNQAANFGRLSEKQITCIRKAMAKAAAPAAPVNPLAERLAGIEATTNGDRLLAIEFVKTQIANIEARIERLSAMVAAGDMGEPSTSGIRRGRHVIIGRNQHYLNVNISSLADRKELLTFALTAE